MAQSKNRIARELCAERIADYEKVYAQVRQCPEIASLKQINDSLNMLTSSNSGTVTEIAEVISRDMSLTSRLLHLVRSVYSGLTVDVVSVEEAIFYLGLKQIRQLALTTRVVDEIEKFGTGEMVIDWKSFWRHSIGCGIITREILQIAGGVGDEDTHYICGLLQDVGKLVMYHVFKDELIETCELEVDTKVDLIAYQNKQFGWNFAQVGALYLEHNNMPSSLVESVLFQAEPYEAPTHSRLAAGVQLAETIVRFGGCEGPFEKFNEVHPNDWEHLEGWALLFGESGDESERHPAADQIEECIDRFPDLLKGLL